MSLLPFQAELLTMVFILLSAMMAGAVLSAWILKEYFSLGFILLSFVVTLALIFVMAAVAQTGNATAILAVSFLFGAALGADLGGFTVAVLKDRSRGTEAFVLTIAIVAGSTFLAAVVGLFSGFNFQGLGGPLFMGLFVLIGISVFGIFVRMGKVMEMVIGLAASAFWVVYMIYDFNKVVDKYEVASWGNAAYIAMDIMLDIVNLFVRLLPIIVEILD